MVHHKILETPNQPAGAGVFTFYGSATINAPAEKVWNVLKYPSNNEKWNPYNPSMKTPTGVDKYQLGDMVIQAYRPEPTGAIMDVPCKIIEIDDEKMRLCWRGCPDWIPYFMLLPEKVQRVIPLEDGQSCLYEVYETQGRPLAYVVKWVLGQKLSTYAQGMATCLKEYVEGLQNAQQIPSS